MNFLDIEQQRQRQKISVAKLCAAAGVGQASYFRMLTGGQAARPSTRAKLAAGLAAAKRGSKATKSYKSFWSVIGMFAYLTDVDITRVLAHDPQMKATSDPKWMEVQRLRAAAIYVLTTMLGVPHNEVATIAGLTEAAVSLSNQRFEGRRDNMAIDRMLTVMELAVSGGEKL